MSKNDPSDARQREKNVKRAKAQRGQKLKAGGKKNEPSGIDDRVGGYRGHAGRAGPGGAGRAGAGKRKTWSVVYEESGGGGPLGRGRVAQYSRLVEREPCRAVLATTGDMVLRRSIGVALTLKRTHIRTHTHRSRAGLRW